MGVCRALATEDPEHESTQDNSNNHYQPKQVSQHNISHLRVAFNTSLSLRLQHFNVARELLVAVNMNRE
jgi:hypothetical protein